MTDESRTSDVLERIDRILRATAGGRDDFLGAELMQDAVIRNLEVIGEASKAVGPTSRRRFPSVPWAEMARFRDLATHHYGRILGSEVWEIVHKDLPQIRRSLGRSPARRPGKTRRK